jgi:hypothetical protein
LQTISSLGAAVVWIQTAAKAVWRHPSDTPMIAYIVSSLTVPVVAAAGVAPALYVVGVHDEWLLAVTCMVTLLCVVVAITADVAVATQ